MLLNLLQFFHAWLLSRLRLRTCNRLHALNATPALIIAPHPDDETLGCGGLIAKKRAMAAKVTVVFLSDGSKGTPRPQDLSDRALAARRRTEATSALHHLDVDRPRVHFWEYADGELENMPPAQRAELIERLAALIRAEEICDVYVTHRCDGHPDHRSAFAFARTAISKSGRPVKLYQYAIWMWWSQPFALRLQWKDLSRCTLHRVGAAREQKMRALQCHQSQLARLPFGFLRALPFETEIFFEETIGEEGIFPAITGAPTGWA